MQSIENQTLLIDVITAEIPVPVEAGHYEAVRYNAIKHGILSKLVVLPHEDHGEFSELLAGMIEEHQPAGMTEKHLVEELATILWRKRGVLLGEAAAINSSLWIVAHEQHNESTVRASVPFEVGLSNDTHDLIDLLTASSDEIAERQRAA